VLDTPPPRYNGVLGSAVYYVALHSALVELGFNKSSECGARDVAVAVGDREDANLVVLGATIIGLLPRCG